MKNKVDKRRLLATPGRTIVLSEQDDYAGCVFLATLAYPEAEKRRKESTRLSTSLLYKNHCVSNGLSGRWDDLRLLSSGDARLMARLRSRVVAGRLALQPIVAKERGEAPAHVRGKHWNLSAALKAHFDDEPEKIDLEPRNFVIRHWRPSLPVIHLAAAWCAMSKLALKASRPVPDLWQVMEDKAFLEELLSRAWGMEPLVESSDLKIPQEVLIKLRP